MEAGAGAEEPVGVGETMKKHGIKSHLSPYSILQKRTTTINHAFASAIAPVDKYDEATLEAALRLLGQNPDGDLSCVYCELDAETWDHLIGLVENGELRGYGHQLGNLVPCCRKCNSKKGAKDWRKYLGDKEEKKRLIDSYLNQFASAFDLEHAKKRSQDDWTRYRAIKDEILKLMKEADDVAGRLRDTIKLSFEKHKDSILPS